MSKTIEVDKAYFAGCLRLLMPATSKQNLRPIDRCIVFKGDHVYASNGHSACVVFYETGLHCAVDAKTLSGVVAGGEEEGKATLTLKDGRLLWSEGKAFRATMQCTPMEQEMFKAPNLNGASETTVAPAFGDALEEVKDFADIDGRFPNRRGVRMEFGSKSVTFCACRGQFAVRRGAKCAGAELKAKSAIVGQESIDLLVKTFASYGTDALMKLNDSIIGLRFAATDDLPECMLYVAQPDVDPSNRQERLDYKAMFEQMRSASKISDGSWFALPEGFSVALARCNIANDVASAFAASIASKDDNTIAIRAHGQQSKVVSMVSVPNKLSEFTTDVDPVRLRRLTELSNDMAIGAQDMFFRGERFEAVMFYYQAEAKE